MGRTARAKKVGQAVSMVTQYDVEVWLRIEAALGRKLEDYKAVVKEEVMERGVGGSGGDVEGEEEWWWFLGRAKGGRGGRDEMDREEGWEMPIVWNV